ncbi:hypothetical protein MRB53_005325 [Persea americana]|uniref:Uncharacterized protein n=1 Tax=Persea americana TaxID=3435 RepID=A0ACC2MEI5_PERAE|nr:hypothetical protein MRB53_005325 [Persea americana]
MVSSPSPSQPFHNITLGSSISTLQEIRHGFLLLVNSPLDYITFPRSLPPRSLRPRDVEAEHQCSSYLCCHMLDSGELVLESLNSSRIWGTFDHPTDTILPTQKLARNSTLSSRRTKDDYSNGKFQLHLCTDGSLTLYTSNVLTGFTYNDKTRVVYNGDTAGNGYELVFDEKGNIGLLQRNGITSNFTQGGSFSTREFYHRATVDLDGVFRHYAYRKIGQSTWLIIGAISSDICMAIISYPGSGVCGFNSYCKLDENHRPTCECPTGYSSLKPNNTLEGCKPNFTAPSCDEDVFRREVAV